MKRYDGKINGHSRNAMNFNKTTMSFAKKSNENIDFNHSSKNKRNKYYHFDSIPGVGTYNPDELNFHKQSPRTALGRAKRFPIPDKTIFQYGKM